MILLTAFEPFAGEAVNSTQQTLEALGLLRERSSARMPGVRGVLLPVTFADCVPALERAVRETAPSAVLCLGQAGGAEKLAVERVGVNLDDARIPDNAGEQPRDRAIDPSGPAAYFSTLPTRAICEALEAAGLPARLSYSAGTFVCNHLLYGALRMLSGTGIPAGFLHLPYLLPGKNGIAPEAAMQAVTIAVRVIRENTNETRNDSCLWKD